MGALRSGLAIVLLFSLTFPQAMASECARLLVKGSQLNSVLHDTLEGLEKLRSESGLIMDTIQVHKDGHFKVLNPATSPSNIAVDLLVQLEAGKSRQLDRILEALEKLPYHKPTGLFFSWYSTGANPQAVAKDVSAIDNMHLALALWTVGQTSARANKLFKRMSLNQFLDEERGLIFGNLKHLYGSHWIPEAYCFRCFGSEARLIYSVGWALGLLGPIKNDLAYIRGVHGALQAEVISSRNGELLKLWDGSAFQLYFPKIFANEERYSPTLSRIFTNTATHMLNEGRRRHLGIPAAHSAVRAAIEDQDDLPAYKDKSGDKNLVSSDNPDVNDPRFAKGWDSTVSPNAMIMAATALPELTIEMTKLRSVKSDSGSLYQRGFGWMDGVHVKGAQRGQVVPVQLSLNQGMIALSLMQLQSSDQMSPSGRALWQSPAVRRRLHWFYTQFEDRLSSTAN